MNEHAQAWVAALRSGEYDQTTGLLHDEKGYCCLGVACDLYIQEHDDAKWVKLGDPEADWSDWPDWPDWRFELDNGELAHNILPLPVREWVGLRDGAGGHGYDSLTGMNDAGVNFEAIAARIEEEPFGLFA